MFLDTHSHLGVARGTVAILSENMSDFLVFEKIHRDLKIEIHTAR